MLRFVLALSLTALFSLNLLAQDTTATSQAAEPLASLTVGAIFDTSPFNAGSEGKVAEFNFMYPWGAAMVGPAVTYAFGSDTLAFTSIGVNFWYTFGGYYFLAFEPAYAIVERYNPPGAKSWLNVGLGVGRFIWNKKAVIRTGLLLVDGRSYAGFKVGLNR